MITPTIGRVVHYFTFNGAPHQAAIIADVHDDRLVNLTVFGHNGSVHPMTSIPLLQPEDDQSTPFSGGHCEWMPFQVKKDTGSESGEKEAGTEEV